jgi:hypothetical protein
MNLILCVAMQGSKMGSSIVQTTIEFGGIRGHF